MEKQEKNSALVAKCTELIQAFNSFEKSMSIDLKNIKDEIELDTLKCGQLQKFKYTLELFWKYLKSYLFTEKGIDAQGPKDVIRQFAKFNHLTPTEIEVLLEIIDDRNKVAHEYKDYVMSMIYPKLHSYLSIIKQLISVKAKNVFTSQ